MRHTGRQQRKMVDGQEDYAVRDSLTAGYAYKSFFLFGLGFSASFQFPMYESPMAYICIYRIEPLCHMLVF
jgi:hypothetical protein